MSIKKDKKGYFIQDDRGTIHAKNIPDLRLAKKLKKEISNAINSL